MTSNNKKTCCKFEVIDKSEYIVIPGICVAIGGFIFAIIAGPTGMAVATGVVAVSGMIAEWRIRALGIAKKLMDSVRDLKEENERLKLTNLEFQSNIEKLETELLKFEDMVGLLGDNVGDLEVAKNQLFDLYKKYKEENERQESNNLLTLFGLVDKNEDSKLSQEEIKRMKEYIKIVYKEEFDFNILDSDDDGFVSLSEFFEKFRNRKSKKVKKRLSRRNAHPSVVDTRSTINIV